MKLAAIIPVKTFEKAKSRLHLGKTQSSAICSIMLYQVLKALEDSTCVDSISIVSRDENAKKISSEFGAHCIHDEHESGVNDAISLGVKYYAKRGFDAAIFVPQDLPLLQSSDIDEFVNLTAMPPSVSLVPSRTLNGTNALLCAPLDCIKTRYDEGSYRTHMQEAREQNITPHLVYQRRIMIDIDTQEDISYCMSLGEKPKICKELASHCTQI